MWNVGRWVARQQRARTVLVLATLVVLLRRVMRSLTRQLHARRLLERLPSRTKTRPGHWLLDSVADSVPADEELHGENIYKWFLHQMTKHVRSAELAGEGLLAMWVLNRKIPLQTLACVFVHDIDLIREILRTVALDDYDKGDCYDVSSPLIGHGVLRSSGPAWAEQRPFVDKGFKPAVLEANMPRISKTAMEHCERWGGAEESLVDVHEEMLKVTLDVLGRVAFSYDIGSVTAPTTRDAPLYDSFDTILRTLDERIRNPLTQMTRNMNLERNRAFNKSMGKLDDVVDEIINRRLDQQAGKGGDDERALDLLDILLGGIADGEGQESKNEGKGKGKGKGRRLTRQQVVDNIKTMLFAGHDTTAAAATWMLYLLAKHPEMQTRMRDEAMELLGPDPAAVRTPDLEKLERMPFLNACVLEVLRLYPSAAFTRRAKQDQPLAGGKYVIPAGVEILIFPYLTHRDARNFPDPDAFKPERWMADEDKPGEQLTLQARLAKETRTRAYLPFSLGKRNCVGRPLALAEIRVIVLNVLLDFDVVLPPAEDTPDFQDWPAMSLTLNPRGLKLLYKKRMHI